MEAILVRFGIYVWRFGVEQVIKLSSKIDAKIGFEQSRFRRGPTAKDCSGLGARRGAMGGGKPPLGVGGSEGRKKRRKEERKKGINEDLKI